MHVELRCWGCDDTTHTADMMNQTDTLIQKLN